MSAGFTTRYLTCSCCRRPLGRQHVAHAASAEEQARKAAERSRMLCAACRREMDRAYPATAEGELLRQAAYAAHRAQSEREWDRCGDPEE